MSDLLKLKKINLKYQTGKENISVLKNIDLTIKKKETVSVVGESGSGKTSLIMLVGGLEKPTSGKIFFKIKKLQDLMKMKYLKLERKILELYFSRST
jgi:putative ABC transport system ATP-binding protein